MKDLESKISDYLDRVLTNEAWEESGAEVAKQIMRMIEASPVASPLPDQTGEVVAKFVAERVEVDGEDGRWYVRILHAPVHHSTEGTPVCIDWTRDGSMVGVEILNAGKPREYQWGYRKGERVFKASEATARVYAMDDRIGLVRRPLGPWEDVTE